MRRNVGGTLDLILGTILVALLAAGCVGVTHEAYYEGPAGQLTDNMIPVKDEARKFDFLLPPGWMALGKQETLPKTLEVPRDNATETGMGVWRKGDKGSMLVWCRAMGQTDYNIEQSLYRISPSSKLVTGPIQIASSGWNPQFRRYDSAIVEKGKKRGFSFFFGTKSQPTLSLYNCNYVVIARSATLEDSDEIENDFIAVLRSLKN
jgi:hypothetical protein